MDSYFIKDIEAISYIFHPELNHIYYLIQSKQNLQKLTIIEEDLNNLVIANRFDAPDDNNNTDNINDKRYAYTLSYYKRKKYLLLIYPSSFLVIWDTTNRSIIFKNYVLKRAPDYVSAFAIADNFPFLFLAIKGHPRVYFPNISDSITAGDFVNMKKIKIPKKINVNDLKCHPTDSKVVVACNDGIVRVWNFSALVPMNSIIENIGVNQKAQFSRQNDNMRIVYPSITCVKFSADGTKLLVANEIGKVYCWDVTQLGDEHTLLTTIRISEKGILSLSWFNYNGNLFSDKILCYLKEGNVKLIQLKTIIETKKDANNNPYKTYINKFVELESLFQGQEEIDTSKFTILPYFSRFVNAHSTSNYIVIMTIKEKKFIRKSQFITSHFLNLKLMLLYDKFNILQDYPVFAPEFDVPIENTILSQDKIKELMFYNNIFYIEDTDIKYYSISKGIKTNLIDFKKVPQLADVCRILKFQMRPITMEYKPSYKFLMNFQRTTHNCAVIASINIEEESKKVNLLREFPCSVSLFLGNPNIEHPPLFILNEDRASYYVLIHDPEKKEEETKYLGRPDSLIKGTLNVKIKTIYWTPLRSGYAVIYQYLGENTLRYSRNRLNSHDILDFSLLNNTYMLKLDIDEIILGISWQSKSKLLDPEQYIGAIICWNKIYFINQNLEQIAYIIVNNNNDKTNHITSYFWYGATFFYSTKYHVYYSNIDGNVGLLFSFDQYENKNTIIGAMNDRIFISSKPIIINAKQAKQPKSLLEIKSRPIYLTEPLILGYLSLCKMIEGHKLDEDIIKQFLIYMETTQISSNLIKALNEHGLINASWYIINNENNIQYTLKEKLDLIFKLKKFDILFDTLFSGKNMHDEGELYDIIEKLHYDPNYALEKDLLRLSFAMLLRNGEFHKALEVLDMLKEYPKIIYLLQLAGFDDELQKLCESYMGLTSSKLTDINLKSLIAIYANQIKDILSHRKKIKNSEYYETIEFKLSSTPAFGISRYNFDLSPQKMKNILTRYKLCSKMYVKDQNKIQIRKEALKDLKRLNMSFGESNIKYYYDDKPTGITQQEIEKEKKEWKIDPILSSSLIQYLGYNIPPEQKNKAKNNDDNFMNPGDEENDKNQGDNTLLILWRFDEGKGLNIENLVNLSLSGLIELKGGNQEQLWVTLDDGDPMELEDKWGKKCPPQYAINFKNDVTTLKCSKRNWFTTSIDKFSIEFWLKPKAPQGLILEIGNGNFVIGFNELEINIIVASNPLNIVLDKKGLVQRENVEDEEPGQYGERINEDQNNKVKLNFWNHCGLVYDSQARKFQIYLNCMLIGSADSSITPDLFKDQILILGKEHLNAEITEFRFWNTALSYNELKEQYRMPLEIVYEKKREMKFKFKKVDDKSKNNLNIGSAAALSLPNNQNRFSSIGQGLALSNNNDGKNNSRNTTPVKLSLNKDELSNKKVVQGETKIEFKSPFMSGNINTEQAMNTGWDQEESKNETKNSTNFTFDNFGFSSSESKSNKLQTAYKISQPTQGDDFASFDTWKSNATNQTKNEDFQNFKNFNTQFKTEEIPTNKAIFQTDSGHNQFNNADIHSTNDIDANRTSRSGFKARSSNNIPSTSREINFSKPNADNEEKFESHQNFYDFSTLKMQISTNNLLKEIQNESNITEINQLNEKIEMIHKNFSNRDIEENIKLITQAFDLLKDICLQISKTGQKDKLMKCQNLIKYIGTYRFATQLLIGIRDIKTKLPISYKKLSFLYIILISLNLKHSHKLPLLMEAIDINIRAKNYELCNKLVDGLLTTKNYELFESERNKIIEMKKALETIGPNKDNQGLSRINCVSCKNSFEFIGDQTCPKCSNPVYLCYQTLVALGRDTALACNACQSCFSKNLRKDGDRCPLCRIGLLNQKV